MKSKNNKKKGVDKTKINLQPLKDNEIYMKDHMSTP